MSLLGRPHAFERGDRVFLTTPLTIAKPTEAEVEEFAFASSVKTKAPNEHIGWLSGRYVEAGRPNLNNAMWLNEELAIKSLTPMLMPVTVMHDPRTAVGTIADCKLVNDGTSSRIDNILAVWMHRFPDVWEEAAANIERGEMMQSMECVPVDTEILTRRGWRHHDDLLDGDETVGFNPATGHNEWTRITGITRKRAEVFNLFTGKWRVRCTAAHGWLARLGSRVGTKQVFGEVPKRVEISEALGSQRHELFLSAIADLEDPMGHLPITPAEAAVVAWIVGDGSIRSHRGGKDFQAMISQAKPDGVMALEMALADAGIDYSITERAPNPGNGVAIKQNYAKRSYYLPAAQARELWLRAELDHLSWTTFICRLSSDCRAAFMEAIYQAEGNENHGSRCIAQMPGPLKDAIALGAYLEGYRPVSHDVPRTADKTQANSHIRLCRPDIKGTNLRMLSTGDAEVWCPTTELGTWTMRQDDQIMLTGNCLAPSYHCSECAQPYVKLEKGAERASWCDCLQTSRGHRILQGVCFTGTGLIFGSRGAKGAYTEAYLDSFHDEIAEYHSRAHIDGTYRPSEGSNRNMAMVQIEESELANLRSERDTAKAKVDEQATQVRDLTAKVEQTETAQKAAEEKAEKAEKDRKDLEEKAQATELGQKRMGDLGAGFLGKLGEFTRGRLTEAAGKVGDEEWEAMLKEKEELAGVKRDAAAPAGTPSVPPVVPGTQAAGSEQATFSDEEFAKFCSSAGSAASPGFTPAADGISTVTKLVRSFEPKKPETAGAGK